MATAMHTHEKPTSNVHHTVTHDTQGPIDWDDPHRAALADNPEKAEKVSISTLLAVMFLGLSYVAPIACGFVLVTGILFQVGTDLGDVTNISWIAGGWSIASSVSFSIAGKLSDIFGRRWVNLSGQVFILIGSIVAATAHTTLIVVCGSTFIGFGCGIIFVSYAGIPEMLPNKWRGAGLGFTELCMTIPWAATGTLIGNSFVSHTAAKWRWCYYIAIIYCVISVVGTYFFYYPPPRPQHDFEKSRWQEVKELDYIGVSLYTVGLTVFLIGLAWAGSVEHPWNSASVIAPIVVGFVVFALCFVYDFTLAKQPFFPFHLFKQVREFTVLLVIVFVAGMVFYSMAGLLPQATMYMFTNVPLEIGIIALPNGFGQFFGGAVMPSLSGKIKHLRTQIVVALILQTLFVALYSVIIPQNKAAWMAFQFFGMGSFACITLIAYVIAGLHVNQRDLGVASGLIGTFRSGGGSVGNAIFNTILNGVINDQLPKRIAEAGLANGLSSDAISALIPATIENGAGVPGAFAEVPGITPAIQEAAALAFRDAYAFAFKRVFWSTIPFGVIAIICAFFIKDPSRYLTNHVAIHMEKDALTGQHAVTEHSHETMRTEDSTGSGSSSAVRDEEKGDHVAPGDGV